MALAHAILTALSHEPLSGYDLTKAFRTSTGYFWRATRQQIYGELRRLETKGMIVGERHEQDRLPDKILWSMTPQGGIELSDWLDTPVEPASIKEELTVKLYALDLTDLDKFRIELSQRRAHHDERINLYEMIESRLLPNADDDLRQLGRLLGVRAGLYYEKGRRDWCDEALSRLNSFGVHRPRSRR